MKRQAVTVAELESALVCMRAAFVAATDDPDWPAATFLDRLRRDGHLSAAHVWAVERMMRDYQRAHAERCGSVALSDVVDKSFDPRHVPIALDKNQARRRLNALGDALTREEAALLLDLLVDFRDRHDGRFVRHAGRVLSAFTSRDHMTGVAVGKVTSLLNRVARFYGHTSA